jgi:hypothetical protein
VPSTNSAAKAVARGPSDDLDVVRLVRWLARPGSPAVPVGPRAAVRRSSLLEHGRQVLGESGGITKGQVALQLATVNQSGYGIVRGGAF